MLYCYIASIGVMTKMCGEHIQASMRRPRFPPISAEDTVGRQFPASLSTFFRRKRWSQNAGAPTLLRPALRLLAGSSKASEPTRLSHGGCDRHDARAFPSPPVAPARPLRMTSRGERFTLSPHILALSLLLFITRRSLWGTRCEGSIPFLLSGGSMPC